MMLKLLRTGHSQSKSIDSPCLGGFLSVVLIEEYTMLAMILKWIGIIQISLSALLELYIRPVWTLMIRSWSEETHLVV